MVIWLHDNNYTMIDACSIAAEGGQLEIIKWLHSKNYLWNEDVCHKAASNKHFELLKWLHEMDVHGPNV